MILIADQPHGFKLHPSVGRIDKPRLLYRHESPPAKPVRHPLLNPTASNYLIKDQQRDESISQKKAISVRRVYAAEDQV